MSCRFLDSETFEYLAEDSHQGRHTILRRFMDENFAPGNLYLTVQGDTFYIWEVSDDQTMHWLQWSQCELEPIKERYLELERERLLDIQPGHDGFYACLEEVAGIGSEIEITPRMCYVISDDVEKWIVDLSWPTGTEVATFYVFGKQRVEWFQKRAVLDQPMTIALRNFYFKDVVI